MPDLSETSDSYRSGAATYDLFSRCEDAPGLVAAALSSMAVGAPTLDLGCGTGKYLGTLSAAGGEVTGADRSPHQLAVARARSGGARLVAADATDLPFPDGAFGMVAACWVLGTVAGGDRRERALAECVRVARPGGRIVLVENDEGGEFEAVRGRVGDPGLRTRAYNRWLEGRGFLAAARFETRFEFEDAASASATFGAIWGPRTAERVTGRTVAHRIVVYERRVPLSAAASRP